VSTVDDGMDDTVVHAQTLAGEREQTTEHDLQHTFTRQKIGPFDITGVLGSGGMGIVYRGVGPEGEAAVKVLMGAISPDAKSRFAREAAIRIEHPNIIRVLAADVEREHMPYIAFEVLEGDSLEDVLRTRRLTESEAISVGVQACRGLAFAHERGIVHRDLKPANLFLTKSGDVKLLDFGIAALTDRNTRITTSGVIMGTPSYLSPEQAKGEIDVDARADVWGLGAVLYHAVAGKPPFVGTSVLATIVAVIMQPLEPLSACAPQVSARFAKIIDRALFKAKDDRWATVQAMHDALSELEQPGDALGGGSRRSQRALSQTSDQRVVAVLLAQGVRDQERLQFEIDSRGGTVLPIMGKRAVGLFGLRAWTGEEVQSAVEAGRAVLEFAERVAVTTGRAAKVGDSFSGAALASAEACCEAAPAGLVLNRDAARALSGIYRLDEEAPGLFVLHGDRIDDLGAGNNETTAETLVGRDAEFAMAKRAVRTAVEDQSAVTVLISGAAGMGKGRLCQMVMAELEDVADPRAITMFARARPHLSHTALSLFRSLLEHRLENLGLDMESTLGQQQHAIHRMSIDAITDRKRASECADFLAELLGIQMPESPTLRAARSDPQLMADQLRRALRDYCAALLETHVLGIFAEDIQWADPESLRVLADIVEHSASQPLLVVTTARPEFDVESLDLFLVRDVVSIELLGLASFDVGRLAQTIAGRALSPALVRALHDRTGGNPLFVEQIVNALAQDGKLDDAPEQLPLPLTVEAAVQSRLDQLSAEERDLLKSASILGRPFRYSELTAMGVVRAEEHLPALVAKGILAQQRRDRTETEPEFRFKSSLISEVANRMIGDAQRIELHKNAASYLASLTNPDPEEVARHYEAANILRRAAMHYAVATLKASAQGDSRRVARCGQKAIQLGCPRRLLFDVYLAFAESFQFLGRTQEELAVLKEANKVAANEVQRARVLTEQVRWHTHNRELSRALEMAEAAVEAARASGSDEVLAPALGRRAVALINAGRLTEAGEVMAETELVAASCKTRIRALAAAWRGQLDGAQGDLGSRTDAFAVARDLYAETGDVRRAAGAAVNQADGYNRLGCFAEAEMALVEALDGCRTVGNRPMEGYALLNLGYSLAMLDRLEEAQQKLEAAHKIAMAIGDRRLTMYTMVYQARVAMQANRASPDLAESLVSIADEAQTLALWGIVVSALTVAARMWLDFSNPRRSVMLSSRAMGVLDRVGGVEEGEAEAYLVHAAALGANERWEEAASVRERGASRVFQIAEGIKDPELRDMFLRRVPAHRELVSTSSTVL
jgi:eukaryotic-like serine/threonine-protein kinase